MPVLSAGIVGFEPFFIARGEGWCFGSDGDEMCHFFGFEIPAGDELVVAGGFFDGEGVESITCFAADSIALVIQSS